VARKRDKSEADAVDPDNRTDKHLPHVILNQRRDTKVYRCVSGKRRGRREGAS